MTTAWLNRTIQDLIAVSNREDTGLSDGELLTRYLSHQGEAALAALVRRHALMVWGVCRRQLSDPQAAEDAFQATFLVLIRKAASVAPRDAVGNWLYGVAHKMVLRVRTANARKARREQQVDVLPDQPMPTQPDQADLRHLIDAEIAHLPDRYRAVIVLCDLHDLTRKEAAERLGLPEGTIASRLSRARAILGKRLVRRGVTAAGVMAGATTMNVPLPLVMSTIKAASLMATGQAVTGVISPSVAALMTGATKAMFLSKIKSMLTVTLVVGFAIAGMGFGLMALGQQPPEVAPGKPEDKVKTRAPIPAKSALTTLEQKLVGVWIGDGACVGTAIFQSNGVYHQYGYGPGAGMFQSGTWKIEWSELPPMLVMKEGPTEGDAAGEPFKVHLLKLNDKVLDYRWSKFEEARVENHFRGTEMDNAKTRIKILDFAVQRYLGNKKHGAGTRLPPNLKTLIDTKILSSSQLLLDPWGGEYRYDVTGKKNKGKKPDIWTETKDKKTIGNWALEE